MGFDREDDLAGSYCVLPGSVPEDDDSLRDDPVCSKTSDDPLTDCGNGRQNP